MQSEPAIEFLTRGFLELGRSARRWLRGPRFCKMAFSSASDIVAARLSATWSAETGLIEFHGANGELLRTVSGATNQGQKAA